MNTYDDDCLDNALNERDRLREEIISLNSYSISLRDRVRTAEAAIARVRELCAYDPTLLWPGQQILDALGGAE